MDAGALQPQDIDAQLERLYQSPHFRGAKQRRLLDFLVSEWRINGGRKLALSYIGKSLKDEPETFEEDSDKWGYPKTRANLAHLRKNLRRYFETQGYRDPVIIKLNPGSYVPVIDANPISTSIPLLEPEVESLILRAKTCIDLRTLRGAVRALGYYQKIPVSRTNPRQIANIVFLPMAAAPIAPTVMATLAPYANGLIAHIKTLGVEPWESVFAEACGLAAFAHDWRKALTLFELSVTLSQEESKYLWWYTALLACLGRSEEAIGILEGAVQHFSRTNIATRTDLAMLLIQAKRFSEAEDYLLGSRDFCDADNPQVAAHLALLYEAQDKLDLAFAALEPFFRLSQAAAPATAHALLCGLFALIMGRGGANSVALAILDILTEFKESRPASSSVEIALVLIGLNRQGEAVECLRRAAFEEYDPTAMWFHLFPPLRHLQGNSAYQALLHDLHLPR